MKNKNNAYKILATGGLILLNAMVVHEVLSAHLRVRPLSSLVKSHSLKVDLAQEWRRILGVNYDPVFKMALRVLDALPSTGPVNSALQTLADTASRIAGSRALLRHDLFGRVYHQLLLGKLVKYYATYYTSIPAARLLARLALTPPLDLDVGESVPRAGESPLRVVDPACGSGTLLSAVYKEIRLRHTLDSPSPDPKGLHRYLVEEGLWGMDVLHHAIHLAATTLFLHEPGAPVTKSRLYVLELGVRGEQARLGSLDLLRSSVLPVQNTVYGAGRGPRRVSAEEESTEALKVPRFHLVIMNPPFTRSVGGNLLFGGLPEDERRKLQAELRALLRREGVEGIGQAGLAAAFVVLADRLLEPGGRLALVLPKSVLGGESWRRVREKLLEDYHVEYIISSFEPPRGWGFSENTDLSEILLVARKLPKEEKGRARGYTVFANLWRRPVGEAEAIVLGTRIAHVSEGPKLFDIMDANAPSMPLRLAGRVVGEAYTAQLDEVDFGHLATFAQAELNRAAALLRRGLLYVPGRGVVARVPLKPLGGFLETVGPDRRQVHSVFEALDSGASAFEAVWGHSGEHVRGLLTSPNAYLHPRPGAVDKARRLWEKRGSLLLAERLWLPTNRVVATLSTREVLSNVWWPLRARKTGKGRIDKALVAWLNSTPGLLLVISSTEHTRGPWLSLKKPQVENLPVIDLDTITPSGRALLEKAFDKAAQMTFKPIPRELEEPEARLVLDETVAEILRVDPKVFEPIRRMLARDPIVSGEPLPEAGQAQRRTRIAPQGKEGHNRR